MLITGVGVHHQSLATADDMNDLLDVTDDNTDIDAVVIAYQPIWQHAYSMTVMVKPSLKRKKSNLDLQNSSPSCLGV